MNLQQKFFVLLPLHFLMYSAVYFFGYVLSIMFIINAGEFFWIAYLPAPIMTFLIFGNITNLAKVTLRNNEQEQTEFLLKSKFTNKHGKTTATPIENFGKYVLLTIIFIIVFGGFAILFYLLQSQESSWKKAEETLNTMFFAFSIIGAIAGISPIHNKISEFVQKHNIKLEKA